MAENDAGGTPSDSSPSASTFGRIFSMAGDSFRQQARDWAQSVIVEPLRTAAGKVALLAVLFTSVLLCIVFLAIGLVQLVGSYFQTPGAAFLMLAGALALVAIGVGLAVGRGGSTKKQSG